MATQLPTRQLEILARLRMARKSRDLSQRELALKLGIGRERLASYEEGRAPLKYHIGLTACEVMGVSHRWLATGTGNMEDHRDIPIEKALTPRADSLYSEAYDSLLSAVFEAAPTRAAAQNVRRKKRTYEAAIFDMWIDTIPDEMWAGFFGAIFAAAEDYRQGHRARRARKKK